MNNIIIENEKLKLKIKLYEISTKIDLNKIENLKDQIIILKKKLKIFYNNYIFLYLINYSLIIY